jgi:hypothetical protein
MNFDHFSTNSWSEGFFDDSNYNYFMVGIIGGLLAFNSARDQTRITKEAYPEVEHSPWRKLLENANNKSFTHITGFSRYAFHELYEVVFAGEEYKTGRPPEVEYIDQLGILLLFLGSRMSYKFLTLIFGTGEANISKIIAKMLERVVKALENHPDARIELPSDVEAARLAAKVRLREETIDNVIGFIDGVLLPIQAPADMATQEQYYQPRIKDTCVNNVFAFSPEGIIMYAAWNYSGRTGDSTLARNLMEHLVRTNSPYAYCVDSGFKRSKEMKGSCKSCFLTTVLLVNSVS